MKIAALHLMNTFMQTHWQYYVDILLALWGSKTAVQYIVGYCDCDSVTGSCL